MVYVFSYYFIQEENRRMSIQLLDCTLRDGGFINDWEFGHDQIVNLFERSVAAGIDIIEVDVLCVFAVVRVKENAFRNDNDKVINYLYDKIKTMSFNSYEDIVNLLSNKTIDQILK